MGFKILMQILCVQMVELVLVALRAFDGKQPCMGKVQLVMKTLE
jgi:hypothetical protein